jgi:hypothetical protein
VAAGKIIVIPLILVGLVAAVGLCGYLLLLGASHAYVSGGLGAWAGDIFNGSLGSEVWDKAQALGLPGLSDRGPIWVEKVDISHLGRNGAYLASTAALATLLPVACVVVGIMGIGYGLFSADWYTFGMSVAALFVLAPLSFFIVLLLAAFTWLSLLIQPCTPGYAMAWFILGIPFIAIGAGLGAAPTAGAVIIVYGPFAILRR